MLASVPESAPASSTGVWIWSLCLDFDRGFVLEVYIVLESGAGMGAAVGAGVGAGVGAASRRRLSRCRSRGRRRTRVPSRRVS